MNSLWELVVSVGVCALVGCSQPEPAARSREYVPLVPDNALCGGEFVRAVVVSIDTSPPLHDVEFRITEVIGGVGAQPDETFVVPVSPTGFSANMMVAFVPPLQVGEEVLWLLRRSHKGLVQNRYSMDLGLQLTPRLGFAGLPVRIQADDEAVRQTVELAGAVRRVARSAPQERWALLEELSRQKSASVAGWAMSVMANVDEPRARIYLEKAIETQRLPPAGEEMAKALLARVSEVWANLEKEDGTDPGYWNTHSVLVATVLNVEETGRAQREFDVAMRPLATLSGPFDAKANRSITACVRMGLFMSAVRQAPEPGGTYVLVLERKDGQYLIPSSILSFMPNETAVLPIKDLSDPAVTKVRKALRKLRTSKN